MVNKGFRDREMMSKIVRNDIIIECKGIFIYKNYDIGDDSINQWIDNYLSLNTFDFKNIFGAFRMVITEADKKIYITDNSNMRSFYYSRRHISESYLDVLKKEESLELNITALAEFFALGNIYFHDTLHIGIKTTKAECYYEINNNEITEVSKNVGDIDEPSTISNPNEFLDNIGKSISAQRVTMSLTGGYDSKLLYATLRKNVKPHIFITGNVLKNEDIVCGEKVAESVGDKLEVLVTEKPLNINEELVRELFFYGDGAINMINAAGVRKHIFMNSLKDKNFSLYITGDGGVLHKDWWWMQDLPFYNKKGVNINRFYNQRMSFLKIPAIFEGELNADLGNLQKYMVGKISEASKPTNTQSYDSFYFNINGSNTAMRYTNDSKYVESYAPLWEREFVKYSYSLPRRKRFFYNSMRDITSKANITIAKVKTIYGTNSSNEFMDKSVDVLYQLMDYGKKAIRMMGRKIFNKSFFVGRVVDWDIDELKTLELSTQAIKYFKDNGFLKKNINKEELATDIVGKMIHIYLLNEFVNKEN